jgi:hypothetical protein
VLINVRDLTLLNNMKMDSCWKNTVLEFLSVYQHVIHISTRGNKVRYMLYSKFFHSKLSYEKQLDFLESGRTGSDKTEEGRKNSKNRCHINII